MLSMTAQPKQAHAVVVRKSFFEMFERNVGYDMKRFAAICLQDSGGINTMSGDLQDYLEFLKLEFLKHGCYLGLVDL